MHSRTWCWTQSINQSIRWLSAALLAAVLCVVLCWFLQWIWSIINTHSGCKCRTMKEDQSQLREAGLNHTLMQKKSHGDHADYYRFCLLHLNHPGHWISRCHVNHAGVARALPAASASLNQSIKESIDSSSSSAQWALNRWMKLLSGLQLEPDDAKSPPKNYEVARRKKKKNNKRKGKDNSGIKHRLRIRKIIRTNYS